MNAGRQARELTRSLISLELRELPLDELAAVRGGSRETSSTSHSGKPLDGDDCYADPPYDGGGDVIVFDIID